MSDAETTAPQEPDRDPATLFDRLKARIDDEPDVDLVERFRKRGDLDACDRMMLLACDVDLRRGGHLSDEQRRALRKPALLRSVWSLTSAELSAPISNMEQNMMAMFVRQLDADISGLCVSDEPVETDEQPAPDDG
mgnify:CR=1 FL=1